MLNSKWGKCCKKNDHKDMKKAAGFVKKAGSVGSQENIQKVEANDNTAFAIGLIAVAANVAANVQVPVNNNIPIASPQTGGSNFKESGKGSIITDPDLVDIL